VSADYAASKIIRSIQRCESILVDFPISNRLSALLAVSNYNTQGPVDGPVVSTAGADGARHLSFPYYYSLGAARLCSLYTRYATVVVECVRTDSDSSIAWRMLFVCPPPREVQPNRLRVLQGDQTWQFRYCLVMLIFCHSRVVQTSCSTTTLK